MQRVTLAPTDPQLARQLHAALRKARLVYAVAVVAALWIVLSGIQFAATSQWDPPFEDDALVRWELRGAFAVVSVIDVVTLAYLRRYMLVSEREPTIPLLSVAGPLLVRRLFAGAILTAAFTEAIVIYGLLLTLLGGQWIDAIAFGAAALLLFAAWFPRRDAWEADARRESLTGTAG